jgi:molecular chaperone GrpE
MTSFDAGMQRFLQKVKDRMTPKKKDTASPEEQSAPETEAPALDLEALQVQLTESQAKVQEFSEGWARERADFSNYKKRVERDNAQVYQNAKGDAYKRILPVLDDLERALANRPAEDAWANGVELIVRKFQATLEAEGVTRMDAVGKPFDPNLHEAILQEPSAEHESGTVIAVLQHGYVQGERVLRPALVKVAE